MSECASPARSSPSRTWSISPAPTQTPGTSRGHQATLGYTRFLLETLSTSWEHQASLGDSRHFLGTPGTSRGHQVPLEEDIRYFSLTLCTSREHQVPFMATRYLLRTLMRTPGTSREAFHQDSLACINQKIFES